MANWRRKDRISWMSDLLTGEESGYHGNDSPQREEITSIILTVPATTIQYDPLSMKNI